MSKLRELALDNGPDVQKWSADDQREAVVELFERDEAKTPAGKYPDWICDALAELSCQKGERLAIIAALKVDDPQKRSLLLGAIFEQALTSYPLDSLAIRCVENIHDWRTAAREAAA